MFLFINSLFKNNRLLGRVGGYFLCKELFAYYRTVKLKIFMSVNGEIKYGILFVNIKILYGWFGHFDIRLKIWRSNFDKCRRI